MIVGRRNAPPRNFYPETYLYLTQVGLPRQYLEAELADYQTDDEAFALILQNYSNNIHDIFNDCINLTLCGINGGGKTFIGTILLKNAFRSNYSVRRIIFPSFINDVFGYEEAEDSVHPLTSAIGAEFLLIDEIGKETDLKTGANISLLETLLKKREEYGYPSIVCTNLTKEGVLKRYGETVHSMISNQALNIEINMEDRRKEVMQGRLGYRLLMGGIE